MDPSLASLGGKGQASSRLNLNIDTAKRRGAKLTSQILDRIASFVEENGMDSA